MKPSRTLYPKPQGLAGYLERLPQLRSGLSHARASIRSERVLQECLPAHIVAALHSIRLADHRVVISVTSPEAAHWVRLHRTELERVFADKGLKFNEVLANVQSKASIPRHPRVRPGRQIAEKVSAQAETIASERLQTSLARLAKTLGK